MSIGEEIDRLLFEAEETLKEINAIDEIKNNQLKAIYSSFLKCAKKLGYDYRSVTIDDLEFNVGEFQLFIYSKKERKRLFYIDIISRLNNQFHEGPDSYRLSFDNEVFANEFIENWKDYLLKFVEVIKNELNSIVCIKKANCEMNIL